MLKPGDPVMVLPSGRTSRVKSIVTYDGEMAQAFPPMSVTVCLEDEIDISRGDMLVPPSHPPHVTRRIDARLVWMHEQKLEIGRHLSAQAHHPDRARRRAVRALPRQHQYARKRAAAGIGPERYRRGGDRNARSRCFAIRTGAIAPPAVSF